MPWQAEVSLHGVEEEAGVAVHWAKAKIALLLDQRRSGAAGDEVRRAVIDVAIEHHLVSPYTSLVAVDVTPVRPAGEGLESHAMETNLPDGWDYTSVFGLGQGATAAPLHLALGLSAIALAALLWVCANGRPRPSQSRRAASAADRARGRPPHPALSPRRGRGARVGKYLSSVERQLISRRDDSSLSPAEGERVG